MLALNHSKLLSGPLSMAFIARTQREFSRPVAEMKNARLGSAHARLLNRCASGPARRSPFAGQEAHLYASLTGRPGLRVPFERRATCEQRVQVPDIGQWHYNYIVALGKGDPADEASLRFQMVVKGFGGSSGRTPSSNVSCLFFHG